MQKSIDATDVKHANLPKENTSFNSDLKSSITSSKQERFRIEHNGLHNSKPATLFSANQDQQAELNLLLDVLIEIAFSLYTCCAETRLIVMTSERIAKSYGYSEVQVGVSPDFILVSLSCNGQIVSRMRKTAPIGINMSRLAELTALCLAVERHELTLEDTFTKIKSISNFRYNPIILTVAIAISTFAFGFLNGGALGVCLCGLLAGGLNMATRLLLMRWHLFPLFVFLGCGFIGPVCAGVVGHYMLLSSQEIGISMMISVLLLVPGFPFINAVLDLFKGYFSMGIMRLVNTILLLLSVSVGFTFALRFLSFIQNFM